MIPGNASHIYVDAHGNKGFSGGPVVFVPNGRQPNEFCVAELSLTTQHQYWSLL